VTGGHEDHEDVAQFDALIERSSLGALGARQLRERIPHTEAESILQLGDLLAIRQDPQIRKLALRYARDPGLAEEAIQTACYAIVAMKHLEEIGDLRAYFCRVLLNEVSRLRAQLPDGPGEPRQHDTTAGPQAPSRPIDDTAGTVLQTQAWLKRFAVQQDHLRAAVSARSDQPDRYRAVIVTAAELILRDAIDGQLSEADSNNAFRTTYPEYFDQPGAAANLCHQRFRRAREDVRAVLRIVVRRDELLP